MFHRPDATVGRLEAIRGGTSSIITANAPGGIFNFISKTGGQQLSGSAKLTGGLNNNETAMSRLDAEVGGPLRNKEWTYHVGGFLRRDAGAYTMPFIANQGGQIKANFTKILSNGQLKFYFKHLNDRVTFYKQTPVMSLEGDNPYGNFNTANSSTFPDLKSSVPNSVDIPYNAAAVRDFDANNAIRVHNTVFGVSTNKLKGDWQINNNAKLSFINQRYRQYQGNFVIPTGLAMTVFNLIALFPYSSAGPAPTLPAAPAPAFPTYRDAVTGEIVAKFSGVTPAPNVPNQLGNFVYGTVALNMTNRVLDVMDNFSATYTRENHRLTLGAYGAFAATKSFWNVDFFVNTIRTQRPPFNSYFCQSLCPCKHF